MPNEDGRDNIMRHFPTLLKRWKGVTARLLELTVAHPTLRIVLYDQDRPGCLEVICIAPEKISAPCEWQNANLIVEKVAGAGGLFNVVDREAGVEIGNCGVEIKEFPQKWYE